MERFGNSEYDYFTNLNGKKVLYKDKYSIYSISDEKYLSENLHYIDGKYIRYQYIGSLLIGAFIFDKDSFNFFPIVTDYKGSVR